MEQAIRRRVRVCEDGVLQVQDPALVEGTEAEVIILVPVVPEGRPAEDASALANIVGSGRRKSESGEEDEPFENMLGAARGLFSSAEEVDQYIRDLRDEWD